MVRWRGHDADRQVAGSTPDRNAHQTVYRLNGGAALRLGRYPQAWPKVTAIYGFRHLRSVCPGQGSAPDPCARVSSMGVTFAFYIKKQHRCYVLKRPLQQTSRIISTDFRYAVIVVNLERVCNHAYNDNSPINLILKF